MLGSFAVKAMDTEQKVFRKDIKSLQVYNPENFMYPPVIRLNSNDQLNINFDILGDEAEYLKFKLIHCNADWKPSSLMENEYLGGFNEEYVDDFAFSSNTYIHYVNYNISIPNSKIPIIHSGNYLLQVFPEDQPDDIILQARFSVYDSISNIQGGITTRTDKGVNSEYQQLFLNIDISNVNNINPYQDLLITITQNNRPETQKIIKNPIKVQGNQVIFEHVPDLIFEAGNEYRRFETVRSDYSGMNVDSVKFLDGSWHAWLKNDKARNNQDYYFDKTQNGRYKIDEYNSSNPDLGADYIMVHFTMDPSENIEGKIYLEGDFTNNLLEETYRMKYDGSTGKFHNALLLKQGSYNYQYTVIPEDGGKPSSKFIEGNKFQTNNEYLIKVFLRLPGARADQLIGFTVLNPIS